MFTRAEEETVVVADRWVHSTEAIAMTLPEGMRNRLLTLTALERLSLPAPLLTVLLNAPDTVLDGRLTTRGESLPPYRVQLRRVYRDSIAPMCDVTVSTADPVDAVERKLLRLATEALKGELG